MVPLNFSKVHRNQNGSRQIWTWKWFVQNEDVLICFRASLTHPELIEVTLGGWQLNHGVVVAHEAATVEFLTRLHRSWNVGRLQQIVAVRDSNKLGWTGEDRHRSSLAGKRRDSRWVVRLQVAFHAILAGFDATGWSGGDAGVLCSVEGLSPVEGVAGTAWSGGSQ